MFFDFSSSFSLGVVSLRLPGNKVSDVAFNTLSYNEYMIIIYESYNIIIYYFNYKHYLLKR